LDDGQGTGYLGKIVDTTLQPSSNFGLEFDIRNSTRANLAFFGNGAGVLNGMMCGYGVQIMRPTSTSVYAIENLTQGNVIIVNPQLDCFLAFPTIGEVRQSIENSESNFAVKITVINKSDFTVRLYGRKMLNGSTNYPNVSSYSVTNGAATYLLYYEGTDYNVVEL
jgi:hypothetical protein